MGKKRDGKITIDSYIEESIKSHSLYNLFDIQQGSDSEYQQYIIDKLIDRRSELLNKIELDKESNYLVDK